LDKIGLGLSPQLTGTLKKELFIAKMMWCVPKIYVLSLC